MDFGQALGSAVSGSFGLIGSALNYKYQKKLAEQQNQYNIDMWKMQADYNSPQAQMERFRKAGLNPNLIYGQGTNGNMSQAPQMVTPDAPEISAHLQKLGELFNIEGLRTQVAQRKKAQAEAKIADINAKREADHYEADKAFGSEYDFDPNTGQFVPMVQSIDGVRVYKYPAQRYYKMMHLSDNYRTNSLLLNRANLLNAQYRYLQPQILMSQYEQRYQPWSFWIGNSAKALNALPLPKFNFRFGKPNTAIYSPKTNNRYFDQNIYNY